MLILQTCHRLCDYSKMSSLLQDQRSRVGPRRRSVRISVVDAASEADPTLPTSTSASNVPSRRSTRKTKSFTVAEKCIALPSRGSDSAIDPTKSRQRVTSQKRKQPGKMKVVVNGGDDDHDDHVEKFLHPATEEDRRMWKGWCELESEPVCLCFPTMETLLLCFFTILNIASR